MVRTRCSFVRVVIEPRISGKAFDELVRSAHGFGRRIWDVVVRRKLLNSYIRELTMRVFFKKATEYSAKFRNGI